MKKLVILGLVALFCLQTTGIARAHDDENFQHWTTGGIEVNLCKNWRFDIREELRFGDNASSLYHYFTETGVTHLLNQHLELSIHYRHIQEKKNGAWRQEYRPHINGTIKIDWWRVAIADRSRLEYRKVEGCEHFWIYRNKLSVTPAVKWTRLDIQPYIADEIFYDFDKKDLNRNRLYLGFKLKCFKNLKGELFYLRQSTKSNQWIDDNILGTSLKVVL